MFKVSRKREIKRKRIAQLVLVLASLTTTLNLSKSIHGMFWYLERQQFGILFKVDEKLFGTVWVNAVSITFPPNLDRFLAIGSFHLDCILSYGKTCSKSGFKTPLQYIICYAALKSSLTTLSMSLIYSVWIVWLMSLVSLIVMRASKSCLSRSCSHVLYGVL